MLNCLSSSRSRLRCVCVACVGLFCVPASFAADTVIYSSGKPSQLGRLTARGTILSFRAGKLAIATESGQTREIPADRILQIETDWTPQQQEGDRLFAAGDWSAALRAYGSALRAESRVWVQRQIMVRCIRCFRETDQLGQAAEAFLLILGSDPETNNFDLIPLNWTSQTANAVFQEKLQSWLDREDSPATRLIAASWLLSGPQRSQAAAALKQLATDRDRRIALLAQAQLWRIELVTADEADVGRWQEAIRAMPTKLRGGPYYTLGTALARLDDPEQAALAFMRVPVLFADDRRLAAAALLAAGRELEKASQLQEAAALYRELVDDHASSIQAREALVRLQALTKEISR